MQSRQEKTSADTYLYYESATMVKHGKLFNTLH